MTSLEGRDDYCTQNTGHEEAVSGPFQAELLGGGGGYNWRYRFHRDSGALPRPEGSDLGPCCTQVHESWSRDLGPHALFRFIRSLALVSWTQTPPSHG
jgi:hypothetical protein